MAFELVCLAGDIRRRDMLDGHVKYPNILNLLLELRHKEKVFLGQAAANIDLYIVYITLYNHECGRKVFVSEVAYLTGLSISSVNRRITQMSKKGLLNILQDSDDKRRTIIMPTTDLVELCNQYLKEMGDLINHFMSGDVCINSRSEMGKVGGLIASLLV